jgi:hypothetical protein
MSPFCSLEIYALAIHSPVSRSSTLLAPPSFPMYCTILAPGPLEESRNINKGSEELRHYSGAVKCSGFLYPALTNSFTKTPNAVLQPVKNRQL